MAIMAPNASYGASSRRLKVEGGKLEFRERSLIVPSISDFDLNPHDITQGDMRFQSTNTALSITVQLSYTHFWANECLNL